MINFIYSLIFMYLVDRIGIVVNYNNLRLIGDLNYGIYVLGRVDNYGIIDFS